MNTSWDGLRFICTREALVTWAYRDGGSDKHPRYSIGFGSQTPLVSPEDRISIPDAFRRESDHLVRNDKTLANLIHQGVTKEGLLQDVSQSLWDALASLFYQAGTLPLRRVTKALLEAPEALPMAFLAEDFGSSGLRMRRELEVRMFQTGDYGDVSHYPLYDGNPRLVKRQMQVFPGESILKEETTQNA